MKKKLTILAFSLLLAVGWTNVAQAQLKAEYSQKEYTKSALLPATNGLSGHVTKMARQTAPQAPLLLTDFSSRPILRQQVETLDVSKRASMFRAPRRAENTVTAKATLTFDEADAITYNWVDANGGSHPAKITEPASDSYQIAYLLGTSYMNPNIPGLKYSAVFDRDNPYPNIEFGWDIPNNSRWPSDLVGPPASTGTGTTTNTWSWTAGSDLPNGWSFVDSNCGWGDNGDGTYYVGVLDSSVQPSSFAITIPAAIFTGYSNITVVIRAKADAGYNSQTISVNGSSKTISTTINNYTWNNVDASNGITIDPYDSYTGLASITITGTGSAAPTGTGGGLTIASPDSTFIKSITVTNQSGTPLQSWNASTAYQNGEYNSDGYYTIPNWACSQYFWLINTDGYVSGLVGELYDNHIHIPASLLTGNSSLTVTINAYGDKGGERLVVNGVEKTVTTSAADYVWTITDLSTSYGTVIPPIDNGYTVFLVKVNDNVPAAMHPAYTYSWNNGSTSLIDYLETYIDEVQLLTDGTRLNENTEDAGTMFAYSGELGRFYFLGKGADFWWGSSENGADPHLGPTYDMYEEFSPTSTDNGADITDFYSKLLYGNSYNVIHDCRGMNYFQHYFTMSGLAGDEHRSMTNLIFWIPDNRGQYGERNYNEEYLPHVGLYTITLEAEAEPTANYSPSNRKYDVTLDWVSSLNSILDFSVDQDYELWVYIYDEQGNPVADYKVLDRLQMEDLLVHNNTTFTYQVDQLPTSQTIVYRVKGWPVEASNNPAKGGDFFVLSNLDPVLIPGYENFLSLGVEHYESDFALDEEHNYYRNFLTVANQASDNNPLTAARIQNGEDEYELYRFDVAKPDQRTKAADLLFSVDNNKVEYIIDYTNQNYVDEALVYNEHNDDFLQGYTNPDNLGCPTYGEIATLSEGGGSGGNTPTPATQTVADGTTTNGQLPVNGLYQDYGYRSQMIYTADMLDMVNGDEINSITFYPQAGLKFAGSTITFKLCNTSEANFGTTSSSSVSRKTVSGEVTATINNPSANTSATTWTITFDSPLTYTGGNLLLDVYCVGYNHDGLTGLCPSTYFYGANQTNYQSMRFNGSSSTTPAATGTGYNSQFLPKTTFDYTSMNGGSGSGSGNFTLLNDFLDNSTYTQVGQVVFELPWKSIQVKLQDESAGTSSGYFLIQNGGKLRFVMPAGYNNANLKFVIHNAPVSSNYYDGTFTLRSSTGDTQTITIPSGGTVVDGDKDYDAIFMGISSGDVITITGTHTVDGTPYGYSPDFKYIHVYVQGGTGGISENDALNLDAIKFVDQFKAETKDDTHPKRYGYVLKAKNSNQESGKPEIPVLHTGSSLDGFYTLTQIQNDKVEPLLPVNVMNAEVNMTLSRDPEVYYYTLDRKPSTASSAQWEAVSKLQRREDDSYQEMFANLPQYDDQVCNPPADMSAESWIVDRYDNYDIKQGGYDSFMSYVPVIWTHGDQKNRRIKWDIENRHNSYGAPIWKTGVAQVVLTKGLAQRQEDPSTKWTFAGEDCSLYMLHDIEAEATMPTITNVNYVPYMFRIFVKSDSHKLRGFQQVAAGEDPNKPGEHYEGAYIENDSLLCVWSGYVNDPKNADYGVTISDDVVNGAKVYTFHKDKVDRSVAGGEWDKDIENAIFAAPEDLIQGEGDNMYISGNDLTIVVRFYYLVEGFDASAPENLVPNRDGGSDPAGYGSEGQGFTPGPATGVKEMVINGIIESVTYVNAQGMQSDKPFDGLNIVITRYSNGVTTTTKLMK